ncbi:MBL fold metallo-hydrolase [Mariniflexile litorale]|uniref:MBL fold metallo-hydrolase n=1 Tax=Mariniflexile litorale TaxID=3045158 RepID=A0AAU7EEK4_9FLAO|nr:MBL fold metallo-hydrolase [Mariniflexile sp. KMM 9835]MDQ8212839.1 MBL fold metallo-hydrolase [Mariniflexile sp. KMM 9835]
MKAVLKRTLLLFSIVQLISVKSLAQEKQNQFIIKIGEVEVISLSDGIVPTDAFKLLKEEHSGLIDSLLTKSGVENPVNIQVNAFLVLLDNKKILIDAGAGDFLNIDSAGKLVESLKMAGYEPKDITDILLTHVHADHSGGLAIDNESVFPNAIIHLHELEYNYYIDNKNLNGMKEMERIFFLKEQAILALYKNRIKTFKGSKKIFPEIKTVPLLGHTPGHTAYLLKSNHNKILFWGDMVHIKEIQFVLPNLADSYDIDIEKGKNQRLKIYKNLARKKLTIAGAHIKFPGIGKLNKSKNEYEWIPIE